MSKIGLTNVKFSTDGINYQPLCSTTKVNLEASITDNFEWYIPKEPIECSFTIHKKKNGNIFEKCLYYKNHKKKRIRKKYDFIRILEKGM